MNYPEMVRAIFKVDASIDIVFKVMLNDLVRPVCALMPMLSPTHPQAHLCPLDLTAPSTKVCHCHHETDRSIVLTGHLVPETHPSIADAPKNKYERLENRICVYHISIQSRKITQILTAELEALLRQKENAPDINSDSIFSLRTNGNSTSPSHNMSNGGHRSYTESRDPSNSPKTLLSPGIAITAEANSSSQTWDVMWTNWPPNLPAPELLRHL